MLGGLSTVLPPSDATDPGIFQPPSISIPVSTLKEEEQVATSEVAKLPSTNYDVEPPYSSFDVKGSDSSAKEEGPLAIDIA